MSGPLSDLKTPEGLALVKSLIDKADVAIDGFRPGVTTRLGYGPEQFTESNPRLVYGQMTGWGQTGPLASAVGHDINYIGLTGALHAMGTTDAPHKFVAVGAIEPQFYSALVEGLGLDPAIRATQMDRSTWPAMTEQLAEIFASRPRDEWADHFAGTDACVTPVLDFTEAAADEHLRARGSVIELGGVPQAGPAPKFSRTVPDVPGTPGQSGGDNEAAIRDWGVDQA